MPDRSVKTTTTTNVTVVTTAETVACVLTIPSDNTPDQIVELSGTVDLGTGPSTSSVTIRIRRGATTAGALVGVAEPETTTGTASFQGGVEATDTPGLEAGQQYCLTVQQAAATGNGTINAASLEAILP